MLYKYIKMILNDSTKFHTVKQVLKKILLKHKKAKFASQIVGVRPGEVCERFKSIIVLCNSLVIVFNQYGMTDKCLILLKIAEESDELLCTYGTVLEKLWPQRILLYANFAYLNYKLGKLDLCLKYLYSGHAITQAIKDAGGVPSYEISIISNILTFTVLCKLKRLQQAIEYVKLAKTHFKLLSGSNASFNSVSRPKLTDKNLENIHCLVSICLSAATIASDSNLESGALLLQDTMSKMSQENTAPRKLINSILLKIYKIKAKDDLLIIDNEKFQNIKSYNAPDLETLNLWFFSKDFEKIFFISCFVPHIKENTPLIRASELEQHKKKLINNVYIESSYDDDEVYRYQEPYRVEKPFNNRLRSVMNRFTEEISQIPIVKNYESVLRSESSTQKHNSYFFIKKNTMSSKNKEIRYHSQPRASDQVETLPRISSPVQKRIQKFPRTHF
jgi:hypothetical protein